MTGYAHIKAVVTQFGLSASFWRREADAGRVICKRIRNRRVFDLASIEAYLHDAPNFAPPRQQADMTSARAAHKAFLIKHGKARPASADYIDDPMRLIFVAAAGGIALCFLIAAAIDATKDVVGWWSARRKP